MADDKKRNPLEKVNEPPKSYTSTLVKPRKPDTRDKPMTYRIGEELIERINAAAEERNVEKSGLVKVLLSYALDALDSGELELPIKEKPRKLDV